MPNKLTISDEQKMQFAGIYLLEYMINHPKTFELLLQKEEEDLESILEWLLIREYIEIKDNAKYVPSHQGREALVRFMERYCEFLNFFDIFCAVDLGTGEFAFASYFDYPGKDAWQTFLNDERWEDLRIAVAKFKGIDPVEIVFMNFLSEGRFGRNTIGWQFDLLLGSVWDKVLHVCDIALSEDQLAYETEEGVVSGKKVLSDIITQGSQLLIELKRQENQSAPPIAHQGGEADCEYHVESVQMQPRDSDFYEYYYDPYYRPSFWQRPWHL